MNIPEIFKKPFVVTYESLPYISYEPQVKNGQKSLKKLSDFFCVKCEHGTSYGPTFKCHNETGSELKAVLHSSIGATPSWMEFLGDDDLSINYQEYFELEIEEGLIKFISIDVEDDDEISAAGYATGDYLPNLGSEYPSKIVLDPDGQCIEIDLSGLDLDEIIESICDTCGIPSDDLTEDNFDDPDYKDEDEVRSTWFEEFQNELNKDSKNKEAYKICPGYFM